MDQTSTSFPTKEMSEHISRNLSNAKWDVVIPTGGGKNISLKRTVPFEPLARTVKVDYGSVVFYGRKRTIGGFELTSDCLTKSQIEDIKSEFRELNPEEPERKLPNRAYLVKDRNPILFVYVIEPLNRDKTSELKRTKLIFALGIGFPENENARPVNVTINKAIRDRLNQEAMEQQVESEDEN